MIHQPLYTPVVLPNNWTPTNCSRTHPSTILPTNCTFLIYFSPQLYFPQKSLQLSGLWKGSRFRVGTICDEYLFLSFSLSHSISPSLRLFLYTCFSLSLFLSLFSFRPRFCLQNLFSAISGFDFASTFPKERGIFALLCLEYIWEMTFFTKVNILLRGSRMEVKESRLPYKQR